MGLTEISLGSSVWSNVVVPLCSSGAHLPGLQACLLVAFIRVMQFYCGYYIFVIISSNLESIAATFTEQLWQKLSWSTTPSM